MIHFDIDGEDVPNGGVSYWEIIYAASRYGNEKCYRCGHIRADHVFSAGTDSHICSIWEHCPCPFFVLDETYSHLVRDDEV